MAPLFLVSWPYRHYNTERSRAWRRHHTSKINSPTEAEETSGTRRTAWLACAATIAPPAWQIPAPQGSTRDACRRGNVALCRPEIAAQKAWQETNDFPTDTFAYPIGPFTSLKIHMSRTTYSLKQVAGKLDMAFASWWAHVGHDCVRPVRL